jgi:hypothetical protein
VFPGHRLCLARYDLSVRSTARLRTASLNNHRPGRATGQRQVCRCRWRRLNDPLLARGMNHISICLDLIDLIRRIASPRPATQIEA